MLGFSDGCKTGFWAPNCCHIDAIIVVIVIVNVIVNVILVLDVIVITARKKLDCMWKATGGE